MMSCRWVPICLNGFLCHLRQVIGDVVPRGLEFYIDVLVWPDEGIIVESSRWNLEPGLLSLGRIWHLRAAAAAETGVIWGRRFANRKFVRLDQVRALKKTEILAPHTKPRQVGGSADLSATSAMTKLKRSDCAFDFEPDPTTKAATTEHCPPPLLVAV